MARPRIDKERRQINCSIDIEVFDELNDYCKEVGQTRTTAVERILKKYLDEYKNDNDEAKEVNAI